MIDDCLQIQIDLATKYNITNLRISALISQLSTIKAALSEIINIIAMGGPLSHNDSLSRDFRLATLGCKALVSNIQALINDFQKSKPQTPAAWSMLWNSDNTNDYLIMLGNQTIALNLLITVLQWYVACTLLILS